MQTVFSGEEECIDSRTPQGLAIQHGGHTETLLKEEPRLVRDVGSHACAHRWDTVVLLTKNSEAENTLKEWEDLIQHGL